MIESCLIRTPIFIILPNELSLSMGTYVVGDLDAELDGLGLAGEGRVLDFQRVGVQDSQVGGDTVPALQQHHVTHHQVLRGEEERKEGGNERGGLKGLRRFVSEFAWMEDLCGWADKVERSYLDAHLQVLAPTPDLGEIGHHALHTHSREGMGQQQDEE
jgi:hypothetical protein